MKNVTVLPFKRRVGSAAVVAGILLGAAGVWGQTNNIAWYTINTAADTFYIYNANHLRGLAQLINGDFAPNHETDFHGRVIVLENDVNLAEYGSGFNEGKGWIPIGRNPDVNVFRGVFDGRGHIVSGLFIIDTSNSGSQGLFGQVGSNIGDSVGTAIINLGVTGVNITTRTIGGGVGGIAGTLYGRMENCYSTGIIDGRYTFSYNIVAGSGGVVGRLLSGSVKRCYFSGEINGRTDIGGVVGVVDNDALLEHCYSMGNVGGSDRRVGGIVGNLQKGRVRFCYSLSEVSGDIYIGGIVGFLNLESSNSVEFCVALNKSVDGRTDVGRVAGYAHADNITGSLAIDAMMLSGVNRGVNGTTITVLGLYLNPMLTGDFTAENGWTAEQDKLPGLFGQSIDKPDYLKLRLTSIGSGTNADPYMIYSIGQLAELSNGVNSNDWTINGHYYKLANNINLGIAPYNAGAGWEPIGTSARAFTGYFDGGDYNITDLYINRPTANDIGLFGNVQGGNVINLGLVDVRITGNNFVGGIAGSINGNIAGCYVTGTVTGNDNVGGLVGQQGEIGTVSDSYSAGTVNGRNNIGGIIGWANGSAETDRVNRCYSVSVVNGSGNGVGGIAGHLGDNGKIVNSSALNPIVIFGDEDFGGRIVGRTSPGIVLMGSVAFSGMIKNAIGDTSWNLALPKNGISISSETICKDSSIGDLFIGAPWTLETGKLPGLFGQTVDMPEHLIYTPPDDISVHDYNRDIIVKTIDTVAFVPIMFSAFEFTAGPNPAVRRSLPIVKFYLRDRSVRGGTLTIFDASGNIVNRIRVGGNPMPHGNNGMCVIGSWDLTDRRGKPVAEGTYLVKGKIIISGGKRENVSVVVGVR